MSNYRDFILGGDQNRLLEVDCIGLSAVTIDASAYDTFHLHSLSEDLGLTISPFPAGKTVTIAVSDNDFSLSFVDSILWPGGEEPEFDGDMTMIVITKLSTLIVGGYSNDLA